MCTANRNDSENVTIKCMVTNVWWQNQDCSPGFQNSWFFHLSELFGRLILMLMSCVVTGHIKTSWLPTSEPCQSRRSFRNTLVTLSFEGVKLQWGRCSWGFDLLMCKPTHTHCTYFLYNSVFIAQYKASNYQKKQCYFQVLHCVQTSKIMETFYFRRSL